MAHKIFVSDGGRILPWEMCETTGCPNCVCMWGSTSRCSPCEEAVVGRAEMDRRYKLTRCDPSKKGPMARTFAELNN